MIALRQVLIFQDSEMRTRIVLNYVSFFLATLLCGSESASLNATLAGNGATAYLAKDNKNTKQDNAFTSPRKLKQNNGGVQSKTLNIARKNAKASPGAKANSAKKLSKAEYGRKKQKSMDKDEIEQRKLINQHWIIRPKGDVRPLPGDTAISWPYGRVQYVIDEKSYGKYAKALLDNTKGKGVISRIEKVMDEIMSVSCLYFLRQDDAESVSTAWLHYTNPDKIRECQHNIDSYPRLEFRVVLGYDCLEYSDILHTIMHGLGFQDEIIHPNRDSFVNILWDNIQPSYRHLFEHRPEVSRADTEYDPRSVMQFHERAFSKNGQQTIFVVRPGIQIKPSDRLSSLDKEKLRLAFKAECEHRDIEAIIIKCRNKYERLIPYFF